MSYPRNPIIAGYFMTQLCGHPQQKKYQSPQMEDPSRQVHFKIIDSVYSSLLNDGPSLGIDGSLAADLRSEWFRNIEIFRRESTPFLEDVDSSSNNYESSDEDSSLPKASSEDDLDKLESRISSYMVCLFVKVMKTKNKWKCSFKQGFIFIENVDIPFNNANGELEW